jgi:hypothetical protein
MLALTTMGTMEGTASGSQHEEGLIDDKNYSVWTVTSPCRMSMFHILCYNAPLATPLMQGAHDPGKWGSHKALNHDISATQDGRHQRHSRHDQTAYLTEMSRTWQQPTMHGNKDETIYT